MNFSGWHLAKILKYVFSSSSRIWLNRDLQAECIAEKEDENVLINLDYPLTLSVKRNNGVADKNILLFLFGSVFLPVRNPKPYKLWTRKEATSYPVHDFKGLRVSDVSQGVRSILQVCVNQLPPSAFFLWIEQRQERFPSSFGQRPRLCLPRNTTSGKCACVIVFIVYLIFKADMNS